MKEGDFLQDHSLWVLGFWVLFSVWGFQVAVYRSFVDRIRSGSSGSSEEELRKNRLVAKLLDAPYEVRPWNVEGATLSAAQITLGILTVYAYGLSILQPETTLAWFLLILSSFILSLICERMIAGTMAQMIAARPIATMHMRIARPAMFLIRKATWPLRSLLNLNRKSLQAVLGKEEGKDEASKEVAGHIKTLQEEGGDLEPEIREIVGNTLELRNLAVQDAMVPRNQVVFLDQKNSLDENLSLVRSSGHTRLPLCEGDLDRCLGIVHVKDAFGKMAEGEEVDLQVLSRPTQILSPAEPLPSALKKLLQKRTHMALVRDEFGGTDGVITLEDVLEEVVGEIRDEFDFEEEFIIPEDDGAWQVSGMAPLHELPENFSLGEDFEEAATFGGVLTEELGRIPEPGEVVLLGNLKVEVQEADDTRVIKTVVELINRPDHAQNDNTTP